MTRLALLLSVSLAATASARGLEVSLSDGDPYDRIYISNTGSCAIVGGALSLDFATSRGKIVIDTAYGGVGTKDPMPVEVEIGNLLIAPVADGDTEISILIQTLAPGGTAIVTLDFDNNNSFWFARRVSILSDDVAGAKARFEVPGLVRTAEFAAGGAVRLPLQDRRCDKPQETTVPTS